MAGLQYPTTMSSHPDLLDTCADNGGGGSTSTSAAYPNIITLDVGGRTFKTETATLTNGSGLFKRQLSPSWSWTPQRDGSYFIDADPDLFAHLLRFMRRPEVFPLFYTQTHGFDYDLYNRLQAEAAYFQVHELHEWIHNREYDKAVKVHVSAPVAAQVDDMVEHIMSANQSIESYAVSHATKVYLCPRGIFVHRGNPSRCGAACLRAKGDNEDKYDDENYVGMVSIKKDLLFHPLACRSK
ncbi:hypothetical protein ACEQ8H_004211 [Pleosporales sp. CAS-2024a]